MLPQVEAVVRGYEHIGGVGDLKLLQYLDHACDGVVNGQEGPPPISEELIDRTPLRLGYWPLLSDEPMVVGKLLCRCVVVRSSWCRPVAEGACVPRCRCRGHVWTF